MEDLSTAKVCVPAMGPHLTPHYNNIMQKQKKIFDK